MIVTNQAKKTCTVRCITTRSRDMARHERSVGHIARMERSRLGAYEIMPSDVAMQDFLRFVGPDNMSPAERKMYRLYARDRGRLAA